MGVQDVYLEYDHSESHKSPTHNQTYWEDLATVMFGLLVSGFISWFMYYFRMALLSMVLRIGSRCFGAMVRMRYDPNNGNRRTENTRSPYYNAGNAGVDLELGSFQDDNELD